MRRFWNFGLRVAIVPMIVAIIAVAISFPAHASTGQGELIPSFGTGGVASYPNNNDSVSLVRQTDGKFVEGGLGGGSILGLTRFTADGHYDTAYGIGGLTGLIISGYDAAQFGGIAIQPDNKVLIYGGIRDVNPGNQMDLVVARYTTTGVLDTSFGSGQGYVILGNVADYDFAGGITLTPAGVIVLTGSVQSPLLDNRSFVRELTRSGVVVTSFGTGGSSVFDLVPSYNDMISSVLVQPNGAIVMVGNAADSEIIVARVTSWGALDTTFNPSGPIPGSREMQLNPNGNAGLSIIRDAAGRYVIAGKTSAGSGNNAFLLRLMSNGATDTSFAAASGHPGWQELRIGSTATEGLAVVQDYQGRYVLSGNYVSGFPVYDGFVARFTSPGDLDSTFAAYGASPGIFTYHSASTDSVHMAALVLAPSGDLYTGGLIFPQSGNTRTTIWALTGEAPPPAPLPDTGINLAGATFAAALLVLAGASALVVVRLRRRSVR